jgi:hypothetical protein
VKPIEIRPPVEVRARLEIEADKRGITQTELCCTPLSVAAKDGIVGLCWTTDGREGSWRQIVGLYLLRPAAYTRYDKDPQPVCDRDHRRLRLAQA